MIETGEFNWYVYKDIQGLGVRARGLGPQGLEVREFQD